MMRLRFYKQQGIETRYRALLGQYGEWAEDIKSGDILKSRKEEMRKNPNLDVVAYSLANAAHLTLIDTKLIKEFYVDQASNYIKKEQFVKHLTRLMGTGMAFSEGHVWKHKRTIISKVFNYNFLLQNIPTITAIVNDTLDRLPKGGEYFNLIQESQKITAEVVIQTFFSTRFSNTKIGGRSVSETIDGIISSLAKIGVSLVSFLLGTEFYQIGLLPWHRKLTKEIREFKQFGIQIIDDRIKDVMSPDYKPKEKKDLIETLIENKTMAAKNSQHSEDKITYQELLDEFCTFYVGGMDTTGHTIANVLFKLKKEPFWEAEIRKQIEATIKSDEDIVIDNLKKITHLQDFINECLRQYGPGTGIFPRVATADHMLGPYHVKKGTLVTVGVVENFYNPKYFPDPDKFDPSRWRKIDETKTDPYEYIPFSAGKRNCIGQHMALLEIKICVIQFLRKFNEYQLQPNYNPTWVFGFLYEPNSPMLAKIVE